MQTDNFSSILEIHLAVFIFSFIFLPKYTVASIFSRSWCILCVIALQESTYVCKCCNRFFRTNPPWFQQFCLECLLLVMKNVARKCVGSLSWVELGCACRPMGGPFPAQAERNDIYATYVRTASVNTGKYSRISSILSQNEGSQAVFPSNVRDFLTPVPNVWWLLSAKPPLN